MKRQIRNAIASMAITIFAGVGLIALGQSPQATCPCPCHVQQPVVQPVAQPVVQQTVEQNCTVQQVEQNCTVQQVEQNCTVQQTVQDFAVQPVQLACADLCELILRIEDNADDLRKYFRRSVRGLDCVDDSYYESVREFERATDRLKKNYRRSDCNACDVSQEVQEVLSLANCISAYMDPCSLSPEATEAWCELKGDLSQLAGQFCTTAAFQQPVSLACPVPTCSPCSRCSSRNLPARRLWLFRPVSNLARRLAASFSNNRPLLRLRGGLTFPQLFH